MVSLVGFDKDEGKKASSSKFRLSFPPIRVTPQAMVLSRRDQVISRSTSNNTHRERARAPGHSTSTDSSSR